MKRLLIVVDYQNDFVTGSLGFPQAQKLEARIAEKICVYRQRGDEILFTLDTHSSDYLKTQEGAWLPVEHGIRDTWGWRLTEGIEALREPQDRCICKPCFGSAELFSYLKEKMYAQVELVGVVSNICVLSNAVLVKTALPETRVIVDASCIASNDPIIHEKALDVMEGLQIQVRNR